MCNVKYGVMILIAFFPFSVQSAPLPDMNNPVLPIDSGTEITMPMLSIDPTEPLQAQAKNNKSDAISKPKKSELDVQIISYQPSGGSFVVINGKRLKEGDSFDETSIKKIEKNRIILSNPDRKPLELEYATLSVKKDGGNTK